MFIIPEMKETKNDITAASGPTHNRAKPNHRCVIQDDEWD